MARFRAGEDGAFDDLVRLAYDWLGRRVTALLRSYPAVRLPPDEVLHDRVLGRVRTALAAAAPRTCEELTRLADRHIRWALRDLVRPGRGMKVVDIGKVIESASEPDDEELDGVEAMIEERERAKFPSLPLRAGAIPVK